MKQGEKTAIVTAQHSPRGDKLGFVIWGLLYTVCKMYFLTEGHPREN